jgi:hypothetical protein
MTLRLAGLLALTAGLVSVSGCALSLGSFLAGAAASQTQDPADAAARSAQAQAARLSGALNHEVPPTGMPTVRWVDNPGAPAPAKPASAVAAPGTQPAPIAAARPPAPTTAPALSSEQQAIVDQMRAVIHGSSDPALIRALSSVMLTANQLGSTLDPADLAGLDSGKRALVLSYYQALKSAPTAATAVAAANAEPESPAPAPVSEAAAVAHDPTLKIHTLLLCRRVKGYGVYDAIENSTFLAGRDQKVVIYVELDNFKSMRNPQGVYEVKLAQEVQLYNDVDGLKVWAQPSVDIIDQSHNQRRDFFVVETVQLPARLSVGKYQLKVHVRDRQGDTSDEASVPVSIVADPTLLSISPTDR